MQLSNMEIIELTKKRVEELLATLKNINEGFRYTRADKKRYKKRNV